MRGRKDALDRYVAESESSIARVSEKTKSFWIEERQAAETLIAALSNADKDDGELDEMDKRSRTEYFESAKAAWEVGLALVLSKLNREMVGPFVLGE